MRMSSAYKIILAFLDSESSEIESIKMLNKSGLRVEPCGTPEVTGTGNTIWNNSLSSPKKVVLEPTNEGARDANSSKGRDKFIVGYRVKSFSYVKKHCYYLPIFAKQLVP